jgi:hypothetical protein
MIPDKYLSPHEGIGNRNQERHHNNHNLKKLGFEILFLGLKKGDQSCNLNDHFVWQ